MKLQKVFFILIFSLFEFFFNNLTAETLSVTLSVDVSGTATITPFMQLPGGSQQTFASTTLTNVTGYIFQKNVNQPTFTVSQPQIGAYIIGAQISGSYCVVQLNSENTFMSTSVLNQHLRPSSRNQYSVTLNENDYTQLALVWIYSQHDK